MRQGSLRVRPPNVEEGSELWPHGFSAWIRVGVLYGRTTSEIAALMRPLDLTVAQFDALAHLYVDDDISQQELAERLLVTKGNVTGIVKRLAARGLVRRKGDPADRRTKRLQITAKGRRLAEKALTRQAALVRDMMSHLTKTEQKTLSRLLGKVAAHFDP
jgi:DNA-binding MarR family transcriptional regulator